jgi:MscS family membrane protein
MRRRSLACAKTGSRCLALVTAFLLLSGLLYVSVAAGQKPRARSSGSKPAEAVPANSASGQPQPEPAPAVTQQPPEDPLGRSTPYGCVLGFLRAVADNNLATATQYLDTKLPEDRAENLAKQLKAVLDASLSSSIGGISRDESGNLLDNLRMTREKIGVVRTSAGDLDILLDRVQRDQGPSMWLFSSDTLAQIPTVYSHLQTHDFARYVPAALRQIEFFGLPLWRLIFIIGAIALAILLSALVTRLLLLVFGIIFQERQLLSSKEMVSRLKQPIRILLLSLAVWTCGLFSLSVLARHRWTLVAQILLVLGVAWLLICLVNLGAEAGTRRSIAQGLQDRVAVITLAQRIFKILAAFVVLLILLHGAGVNISAMLAGLGIGGIALALAAQNTLADFFGGISVISRKTIRVGDYCRLADQVGTVEDIGLSSTRLRTLDRTVISIPNAKVAQLASENFALRDSFWFHHTLSLRFDTAQPQIERMLTDVEAVITGYSSIKPGASRVNLIGIQGASYQIEIFAYVMAADYNLFIVHQQSLLFRVLAAISEAGARLAFPSSTTYLETAEPMSQQPLDKNHKKSSEQ